MLTPQEVSTHAFTKAVVGGYNMGMVDEFLDELTDDYTALYKENAGLKAKMKVLVEKVEDYRATEDSMRATLLTAQKMADSIIHEAEGKRDQLLTDAEANARERIGELQREIQAVDARLRQGQTDLSRFVSAVQDLCGRELQFLEKLPTAPVEVEPPAAETPVREIEEKVLAAFAKQEPPAPAQEPEPAPEEETPEPVPAEEPKQYPEGDPFVREGEDATRRINLSDLKFGRNYPKGDE